MKYLAVILNTAIICSMIAIGYISVAEVRANEMLGRFTEEDRHCLAQNIFFEARNQTIEGQVAVAWVTLNRYESEEFPSTLCSVVKQARLDAKGNPLRNQCQFSWYCDGKSDRIPKNKVAQRAWEDAQLIARVVLLDWARGKTSPVKEATMYHADYVKPYWAKNFDQVATVGDHIFYE